jgi:hypothetical protein
MTTLWEGTGVPDNWREWTSGDFEAAQAVIVVHYKAHGRDKAFDRMMEDIDRYDYMRKTIREEERKLSALKVQVVEKTHVFELSPAWDFKSRKRIATTTNTCTLPAWEVLYEPTRVAYKDDGKRMHIVEYECLELIL